MRGWIGKVGIGAILFSAGALHAAAGYNKRIVRCAGGDGPHPLVDITGQLPDDTKLVDTLGGVKEFFVSEARGNILYRNDRDQVVMHSAADSANYPLTTSGLPLSRVADPRGRFLLTAGAPWEFDLSTAAWSQFSAPKGLTHLFWDRDVLYSAAQRDSSTTEILRHRAGSSGSAVACYVKQMKPARGHQFPYAFFYATTPTPKGPILNVYEIDVRNCRIHSQVEFQDPLVGNVREVHRFFDLDAMAISIDHPESNLLWEQAASGCHYHDIGGLKPMVPNYRLPVVATFSKENGLHLIYPETERSARLFGELPLFEIDESQLWLTKDGERLYAAPGLGQYYGGPHPLFVLDVGNAVPYFQKKQP